LPFDGSSSGTQIGPAGSCTLAVWSPDGKRIYFTSDSGENAYHIWRQSYPDGTPEQVTSGPTEEDGIAIAPDEKSLITSVGMAQGTVWIHDDQGDRQISGEGYASSPQLSADGTTLYFLQEKRGSHILENSLSVGEAADRRLIRTNLATGVSEPILSGVPIWQYSVSADGKQIAYSVLENGVRSVWTASADRRQPPRQVSSGTDDSPFLLPNGDILVRSEDHGSYFVYRMKSDGSGREKVFPTPTIRVRSVSPDGQWVVLWNAVQDEHTYTAVEAVRLADGKLVRMCDLCDAVWSADQKYLYFFGSGFATNRIKPIHGSYALPLKPGQMLPDFPPGGIQNESDFKNWGAIPLPDLAADDMSPGPTPHLFAYSRRTIQRNLYRVPLP
jgi:WD40 repeat protein